MENKMIRISLVALGCAALVSCLSVRAAWPAGPADGTASNAAQVDFKSCAKPVYPPEALAARREGTVTLAFLVAVDGTVADAKVARSSGQRDLDETARDAIRQCKFAQA
ncbi:energy transducer TonB [Massilia sp. B-10]|nr:energy transducer TonB [Massilia sp. B-10]